MFSINVILVIHSREKLVWQLNIRQIDAYFERLQEMVDNSGIYACILIE